MSTSDQIALAALVVSAISLVVTAFMTHKAQKIEERVKDEEFRLAAIAQEQGRRAALLQALQGEKEAVGFTALYIAREGLPTEDAYRRQVLMALVQASIFSSSDRARAIVYTVLRDHMSKYRTEILETVGLVETMFRSLSSLTSEELDLGRGQRRLAVLKKAITA